MASVSLKTYILVHIYTTNKNLASMTLLTPVTNRLHAHSSTQSCLSVQ